MSDKQTDLEWLRDHWYHRLDGKLIGARLVDAMEDVSAEPVKLVKEWRAIEKRKKAQIKSRKPPLSR